MVRDSLIRRLRAVVRRHGFDGALALVFVALLIAGSGAMLSGAGHVLDGLAPATIAQASDQPARAGEGRAHLPMFGFPSDARYAPQVLYPVSAHSLPDWLAARLGRPSASRHPVIAICIDDLGEDLAGTDRAMALPQEVALSFLPYAEATPFLAEEAGRKGHVILAHVPMQPLSGADPGAMALTVGAADNQARLLWNIARVPGLSGINNHEGSRFTGDEAALVPVMQTLAARHLFFFDSRTAPGSRGVAVAQRFGVLSAGRDIFLDDSMNEADIRAQLDALAATAKREGVAIAIGHPHDITLKLLAAWLSENHGVTLVTLPEAIRQKSEVALASR